jgi:hypothetical protein
MPVPNPIHTAEVRYTNSCLYTGIKRSNQIYVLKSRIAIEDKIPPGITGLKKCPLIIDWQNQTFLSSHKAGNLSRYRSTQKAV